MQWTKTLFKNLIRNKLGNNNNIVEIETTIGISIYCKSVSIITNTIELKALFGLVFRIAPAECVVDTRPMVYTVNVLGISSLAERKEAQSLQHQVENKQTMHLASLNADVLFHLMKFVDPDARFNLILSGILKGFENVSKVTNVEHRY